MEEIEEVEPALRDPLRAARDRALLAQVSHDTRRMTITTADDYVELWDLESGRRIGRTYVEQVSRALPAGAGFASLADGSASRWVCDGPGGIPCRPSTLARTQASALLVAGDEILVAVGQTVRRFSLSGRALQPLECDRGVHSMLLADDRLVLGYSDGSIELRSAVPSDSEPSPSFEGTPVSRVVSFALVGPRVLAAGYGDGTLGLWSLEGGRLLDRFKLHGPIVHLAVHEQHLYAATAVGAYLASDLRVHYVSHCDLLREVWLNVPVTWERGRPVRSGPPADHPCLRQGGR